MSVVNNDPPDPANVAKDRLREAVEKAIRLLFGREETPSVDTTHQITFPSLPRPRKTLEEIRAINRTKADRLVSRVLNTEYQRIRKAGVHRREVTGTDTDSGLTPTASKGESRAIRFNCWIEEYLQVCRRLDIHPAQVDAYMQKEMRLLGSMYAAAREYVPSRDKLRRLAIRLAIDARQPIEGNLRRYKRRYEGCHLKLVLPAAPRTPGSPHPDGEVTTFSPLLPEVLRHVFKPQPDVINLVGWIEDVYGRQPGPQDTLEYAEVQQLDYKIDGDRVRLWIGNEVVTGIGGKNEQALLRYFCQNPASRISGPGLKKQLEAKAITNPSLAAKGIQKALGSVRPAAAGWFVTKPFRWAEGLLVRHRSSSPP